MQERAESGWTSALIRVISASQFYTMDEEILIKKNSTNTNLAPLTDGKVKAEREPFLTHKILNGFYIKGII